MTDLTRVATMPTDMTESFTVYGVKSFRSENINDDMRLTVQRHQYASRFIFSIGRLGKNHNIEIKLDQATVADLIRFIQGDPTMSVVFVSNPSVASP